MRDAGINTVRLYTAPSDRIADAAAAAGLYSVPDICWGPRTCEWDYPAWWEKAVEGTRENARRLGQHPAMLMLSIGNEIPPLVVRWYGRERTERYCACCTKPSRKSRPIRSSPTSIIRPRVPESPVPRCRAFNVYLNRRTFAPTSHGCTVSRANGRSFSPRSDSTARSAARGRQRISRVAATRRVREGPVRRRGLRLDRRMDDLRFADQRLVVRADRRRPPSEAGAGGPRLLLRQPVRAARNAVAEGVRGRRCLQRRIHAPRMPDGARRLRYPDYEVIVVNDGSSDASPRSSQNTTSAASTCPMAA